MRRAAALAIAALLAVWPARAATHVADARGNLISVQAITALTEGGEAVSAVAVRTVSPDGRVTEEVLEGTADREADVAPLVLFDAGSDTLVVLWSRHDGRRPAIAAATRTGGGWSPTTLLDTGEEEPSEPRAALDADARIHVAWRVPAGMGEALRHRAFDLVTLQPQGPVADPFSAPVRRPRRSRAGRPEGGTDEPGGITATSLPADPLAPPDGPPKPASFTAHGVEAPCGAAVVWRLSGVRLEIATMAEGRWHRGTVNVGPDPGAVPVDAVVADVARRFCRP